MELASRFALHNKIPIKNVEDKRLDVIVERMHSIQKQDTVLRIWLQKSRWTITPYTWADVAQALQLILPGIRTKAMQTL